MAHSLPAFSKKERTRLRQLAEQAREAELATELEKLLENFHRWRSKEINAFDLSDRIHAFHNGENRELYLRYTRLDPKATVPRAIAAGLLVPENIDPALLEKLRPLIGFYQNTNSTEHP